MRGIGVVAPGQWRHFGRIGGDKVGSTQLMLDRLLENLQLHPTQTVIRLEFLSPNLRRSGRGPTHRVARRRARIEAQNGLFDRQSLEGLAKIVGLALIVNWVSPSSVCAIPRNRRFGQIHQIPVIGIGQIELQHGEFGIMAGG
jgi:hypothetical protein